MVVSAKPCIGRVPLQEKKSTEEQVQFESIDDCFSFFDIRGIVHIDWVPEGQIVKQVYYKEVLTTLPETVKKRPEMWKTAHGFFTMTTRRHNPLSIKTFVAKH
jgi:hypothetical protein